jgi:hypothetical protein
MVDVVYELLFTEAAIEKLGRRTISVEEALQLLANFNVVFRNPRARSGDVAVREDRRLMVGTTAGGRMLTLVIEPTPDPADWLVVSGWDSANRERRMWRR